MNKDFLDNEINSRFREIIRRMKEKPTRIPKEGDCFFLNAPTLRPLDEPNRALVVAVEMTDSGLLICLLMSLEYWEASEFDYMLDSTEWTGGYPVIVEAWNPIVIAPDELGCIPIHGELGAEALERIRILFHCHQSGERVSSSVEAVGRALEDEGDPRWDFRAKEAAILERVRRHYHEGWDVAVIELPRRPSPKGRQVPVAAASGDLPTRLQAELKAQELDREVLSTPRGKILVRRDSSLPGYLFIWYSKEGYPAPEVEADPPLEPPPEGPSGRVQVALGFWRDQLLDKEPILRLRSEAVSRDILVRLPKKRK
ncbi:MAG: hypothetical protein WHX93_02145 [bacterium]